MKQLFILLCMCLLLSCGNEEKKAAAPSKQPGDNISGKAIQSDADTNINKIGTGK